MKQHCYIFKKFIVLLLAIVSLSLLVACGNNEDEHEHTFSSKWASNDTYHWHSANCEHKSEITEKAEHAWDQGTETKNATETEYGIMTYSCSVCGYEKTEQIPKLEHTHTYSNEWTSNEIHHWHSATCGHTSEITGNAEHTWDQGTETKPATETEYGIMTYSCSVCGYEKTEQIPKLEHTHTYSDQWTSNDEYHWHGSSCGHESEISDKARHSWDNGVFKNGAECSPDAVIVYTCTICLAEKEESAVAHLYTEQERKAATCTENGYTLSVCSVCGDEQIEILYAIGHTITNPESYNAPLCETAGDSIGICDTCNEHVTITLPATGHTSSEFYFTNDYCGSQKLGYILCTECGITISEFGHSYKLTITQATCDTDGQKLYECSNCNHSYSESIESPGHIAGEWLVTVDADCKTLGEETRYCLVCKNAIQTREINKTEHSYTSTLSVGGVTYTCSICSDTYFIETQEHVTISFVSNGGTEYQALEVSKGETADLPSPTKTDCEFAGWYLDSELKNKCNSTYVFNSDTTLYAAWNASKLTGDLNTNNIITDVPLSYTFQVQSDVVLTNTNLKNYLFAKDLNEATPDLYIASSEGNIYTIAGRDYKKGMSYDVVAREGVSIVGITGNEFWFVVEKENTSNIKFKSGVVFISELDIYSFYEQDDKMYIFFRNDILNPGDIAVIYGDSTQDILLMLEVMAEGTAENAYVYQIEAAKSEDVFSEYDVYYSGELNIENIEFETNLEEELTAQVLASPMYAQFEYTAVAFSRGVTVGNYYYDFNGITVKPSFNSKDSKIFFSITVTAEYARMEINTREVDSLLHITLEVKSTLTFNTTAQVSGFDNFMFVVDVKNTTQINLFVSLGTKQESKKELNYFKELFFKAKDEGKFSELDASYAENSKETILGSVSVNYCGIIFTFDVSNVFSFQVVGEIGVSAQIDVAASFGVKNTPSGGFSTIKSFKASASLSFYMLGKIEVSDMIKVRATVSLCGIVNAYVDISAGPYFMVGGMFTTSIHTGGGSATAFGGYLEIGAKVNASAGVNAKINIKIFRWRKTITVFDKSWNLYSQKFVLYSLGNQKVALYFTDVDESINGEYICGSEVDVSKLIDLNVVMQDLTKMNKTTQKVACQFFLDGDHQNVRLTRDGKLTITITEFETLEIRIKVVSGDIYKYATLIFSFAHNEQTSEYQAPTCVTAGNTEYTYCDGCSKLLSGTNEEIPATGHSYSSAWEKDGTHHWHKASCEHESVISTKENHIWDNGVVTLEPTCTEIGSIKYTCTICGQTKDEDLPANGHSESDWIIDISVTCGRDGKSHTECTVCEEKLNEQTTPATGNHSHDDGTVTLEPTCTEIGSIKYTCTVCGHTKDEDLSANGHSESDWIVDITVTCGRNGKSHTECTVCEEKLNEQTTPATGNHSYDDGTVTLEPTCTEIGSIKYTCTVCGHTKDEDLSANGHSESDWIVDITVTCGRNGKSHTECTVCEEKLNEQTTPATGNHSYDDGTVTLEPTCTETGINQFTCDICSFVKEDILAAKGHSWDLGAITTAPTCYSNGIKTYECYSCGTTRDESLDLIEHEYGEDGSCVVCGTGSPMDFELKADGTYIINGFNEGKELSILEIPSTIKNVGVTEIAANAFANCTTITEIYIPACVTVIGDKAFVGCSSLEKITVETSNMYYQSIDNCLIETSSKTIILGCKNSTIPSDGTTVAIASQAFYNCTGLSTLVIPSSISSIASDAFNGCKVSVLSCAATLIKYVPTTNLTELNVTSGTTISAEILSGCSTLKKVVLADTVRTIGASAFDSCTNLENITFSTALTSIGRYAFNKCSSLETVDLLQTSVKTINAFAFSDCGSMTSIKIPTSVTTMGSEAFANCNALTEVVVSDMSFWYNITFNGLDSNPLYFAKKVMINGEELTSLTIAEGTETIGAYAFAGWENLRTVVLVDTLTSIGSNAFYGCNNIEYTTHDNGLYIGTATNDLFVLVSATNTMITSCSISDKTVIIGENAFAKCASLTSVIIPEDVVEIGANAFMSCTSLSEIVFNGTALKSIGANAFTACTKLTNISLPSSVETIGAYLFYGCSQLKEIELPNAIQSIGVYTFADCASLTKIVLPTALTTIESNAFSGCTSLAEITIPSTVTSIGSYAFSDCGALKNVTFENTSGWVAGTATINSSDLSNTLTSATYLRTAYVSKTWKRS